MARRELHTWPHVRVGEDEAVHVYGRTMTMERWVAVHFACRFLVAAAGVACVAVGTAQFWSRGPRFAAYEGWPARLAWRVMATLQAQWGSAFPLSAEELGWVMFVVGVFAFSTARPVGSLVAGVILLLLGWSFAKRFEFVVTHEHLIVRRRWRLNLLLDRGGAGQEPLVIRHVDAEEYFSRLNVRELQARQLPGLRHPPAIVEIVRGYRRYKLFMTRRMDQAEAIVVMTNRALMATALAAEGRRDFA